MGGRVWKSGVKLLIGSGLAVLGLLALGNAQVLDGELISGSASEAPASTSLIVHHDAVDFTSAIIVNCRFSPNTPEQVWQQRSTLRDWRGHSETLEFTFSRPLEPGTICRVSEAIRADSQNPTPRFWDYEFSTTTDAANTPVQGSRRTITVHAGVNQVSYAHQYAPLPTADIILNFDFEGDPVPPSQLFRAIWSCEMVHYGEKRMTSHDQAPMTGSQYILRDQPVGQYCNLGLSVVDNTTDWTTTHHKVTVRDTSDIQVLVTATYYDPAIQQLIKVSIHNTVLAPANTVAEFVFHAECGLEVRSYRYPQDFDGNNVRAALTAENYLSPCSISVEYPNDDAALWDRRYFKRCDSGPYEWVTPPHGPTMSSDFTHTYIGAPVDPYVADCPKAQ